MTDLTGAEVIRYTRDDDCVITLTIDMAGSANTMNKEFRRAFAAVLDRLEAEREESVGVIITSAKRTFLAGGDFHELIAVTPQTAGTFADVIDGLKADLRRLEQLGRPVVAAINGSALGGGLELALSCHHRIVVDRPEVRIGLPEVTFGLLPGGGGVVKTVRIMGLAKALPLLTEGTRLKPAAALAAGWVDELVVGPDELTSRAKAWILANPDAGQPWDANPGPPGVTPDDYGMLAAAPASMYRMTHNCYPAPEKILAAAVESLHLDLATALRIETSYLAELAGGQISKNLISTLWFQRNEARAGAGRAEVDRVTILNAGEAGRELAQRAARAGIDVVLDKVAERVEKEKEPDSPIIYASIGQTEEALPPDHLITMHFPRGIEPSALVEIVHGPKASAKDATSVAQTVAFACRLDLIPIVTCNLTGLYTTRILKALRQEADQMVAEGVSPTLIRNLATKVGLAPLQFTSAEAAEAKVSRSELDQADQADQADVRDRLLFRGSLEAIHCLQDGTVASARDANLGSPLGAGFPNWTGGALQYVNSHGPRTFAERADHLANAYGDRFRPPYTLRRMATRDETF